jgi:inosine/xanthosine triphosphatase
MKIIIGTKNKIKISALREIMGGYDFLTGAKMEGMDAESDVSDQPKTLEETVLGAKNRAKNAFHGCPEALGLTKGDLGVGVEDGLMEFPGTLTGFMNITICAFYDGGRYYLGMSAGFEYPPQAIELVKRGLDINQAFYKMELTDDPAIGSEQGAVGILTKGRWRRKDTIKQAITSALIQLDNKDLYS